MEIYRNTSQQIFLDLYGATADGTPTVVLTDGNGSNTTLTATGATEPDGVTERWATYIDLSKTQNDQHLKVVWTFAAGGEATTKTDHIDVVTPYVELDEVRAEIPELKDLSDAAVYALERRVRHIIDSFTGATFGRHEGTKTVRATTDNKLLLPMPLISYSTISVNGVELEPSFFRLTPSGNYLGGVARYPDGYITVVGPIYNPYGTSGFTNDADYTVTGIWGWEYVPAKVTLAAKILMADYGCRDSTYRDRYVDRVGTSDWNMSLRAFTGTGNVQADQLLDEFRGNSMVVI
jgi:hypothetical protein